MQPKAFTTNKIYAAAGHKPQYFVVNKMLLQAMGLFSGEMRMFAEMNYLMSDPVILDDSRLRALIGDMPKTSYDEGVRSTLSGRFQ